MPEFRKIWRCASSWAVVVLLFLLLAEIAGVLVFDVYLGLKHGRLVYNWLAFLDGAFCIGLSVWFFRHQSPSEMAEELMKDGVQDNDTKTAS
ncbi:MAG: hypothetical protein FJY76_01910 [Candidatus Aenigmarchaeota archaeon]|nr:hypothetical protein [Candidatus Aenigmarchaeota archaeon]